MVDSEFGQKKSEALSQFFIVTANFSFGMALHFKAGVVGHHNEQHPVGRISALVTDGIAKICRLGVSADQIVLVGLAYRDPVSHRSVIRKRVA